MQASVVHPSWTDGLAAEPVSVPFAGPADGTQLVADFLARADAARARYVTDLAIYLQTTHDGRAVECRTAIVPATFAEAPAGATSAEVAAAMQPIRRAATEHEYRCRSAAQAHERPEYTQERRCGWRPRPVTTTVPGAGITPPSTGIKTHTIWIEQWECEDTIVKRIVSDRVEPADCGLEPVMRTVTRPRIQLDNQYVPPRFDVITRQQLRELPAVCYPLDDAATAQPHNRIAGRVVFK